MPICSMITKITDPKPAKLKLITKANHMAITTLPT
jgi:hypothetical protein